MRNRTLLIALVVVVAAWLYLRQQHGHPLPWNQGQAGSIFSGLQGGGGQ